MLLKSGIKQLNKGAEAFDFDKVQIIKFFSKVWFYPQNSTVFWSLEVSGFKFLLWAFRPV
jgi:hypothetical protein